MENNIVLNQVIILVLIMLVGFIARKTDIINDTVNKKLSELLLNITSPFLIISSFNFKFSQEILQNVILVLIFSVAIHIISIFLGNILFYKYPDNVKKILKFVAVYSNCGFMGFPIMDSLYGKTGVLYASIYVAVFKVFIWTNGVIIFSGKKDVNSLKKAFINPGIVSVVIGMLIFTFSITLPYPVSKTIDMVGSMTTPMSMLIIGAILADIDYKSMFSGFALYYVTAVRLLLIPLSSLVVLRFLGFTGILLGSCVLAVAMPAAATTTLFSEIFGGDSALSSRIIAFSTVLSIVTIPLISLLIS